MAQRRVLTGGVLLAGLLFGASAPWSYALPPCDQVPASQRERARQAGRCEGRAPIVNVAPGAARRGEARAPRRPVPDLRGRVFNREDERLARFIVAVDYREGFQRRDWVLDQAPRPPATLPDGAALRVVLSDGTLVRVPDVRGSFARALTLLHRAGLSWSTASETTSRVIGQAPPPGSAVRPGTPVALKVAMPRVALAPESTRREVAPPPAAPPTAPATSPTAPAPSAAPPAAPPSPPAGAGGQPAPRTPATTAMPDLQGMIFDAARERLAGFSVSRVHRAGTEPAGTVIGQNPAPGAAVAPGASVRLVLSDGSLVRVPRVTSFTLGEARQRLATGELRPVVTQVASDSPAGTVISQQPAEGQFAQRGSAIRIAVSAGPAPPPTVSVPNVVGAPLERARGELARFRIERTERAAREPAGTVLEQQPAPGSAVAPGSTVSIVVSSGGRPEVIEVASVTGQAVDAAAGALSEFRVERIAVPSVEPAGRVLAQTPAAGSTLAPGATVQLRISDGSRVRAPALVRLTLGEARAAAQAAGLEVAVAGERDDPGERVARQDPPAGTEVARGSALQLAVESEAFALPIERSLPPAARDAWTRAVDAARALPPRTQAIVAVVLLALFALLLLARRRGRRYVMIEPVFGRPHGMPPTPAAAASPRHAWAARVAQVTARAPEESPAPEPVEHGPTAQPSTARKSTRRSTVPESTVPDWVKPKRTAAESITSESTSPAATAPEPIAPQPAAPQPAAPQPVAPQPVASPPAAPPTAESTMPVSVASPSTASASDPATDTASALPPADAATPAAVVAVMPAPEPIEIGARARLDADPERTVARNAAPRGPEIRIATRLEAGAASVREHQSAASADELTIGEESK